VTNGVLVTSPARRLPRTSIVTSVSTAVSGIPELVENDVNGLLVPPEDAGALADAIWRLSKDPALSQRLAAAGAETIAEHFDGEVLARRMVDLFAGSVT